MTERPVAHGEPVVLPTGTGRVVVLRTVLASLWLAACLLDLVHLLPRR